MLTDGNVHNHHMLVASANFIDNETVSYNLQHTAQYKLEFTRECDIVYIPAEYLKRFFNINVTIF